MNSTPEGDRGQLMLLAGVVLALVFVILGVLLNSAAFTGAEAARGGASDAGDALSVRDDAAEGVGGALFYANYHNYSGGPGGIEDVLRTDVQRWNDVLRSGAVSHRTIGSVELRSTTPGTQVYQDDTRNFTDDDGNGSWTLAGNATGVRRFAMNATAPGVSLSLGASVSDLRLNDAFYAEANRSDGGQVRVFVYEDTGGDVVVARSENGTLTDTWSADDGDALVELSAGRIDGVERENLTFPGVGGPFNLTYNNAGNIEGTYGLVVDNATVAEAPYASPGSSGPHQVAAVYSATLEVTHRSATVAFVTNATVAPEGTPEGEVFNVTAIELPTLTYAYTDGQLATVVPDDNPVRYDTGGEGVNMVGPSRYDFDGDDRTESPYVNGTGALRLIDAANESTTLETNVRDRGISVGTYNGSNESVFYVDNDDNHVFRIDPNDGTPRNLSTGASESEGSAIAGVGDVDGDGENEVAFLGTSNEARYVDDDGSIRPFGSNIGSEFTSFGNARSVGAPDDFDGDGVARVPLVDGSGNVALLATDGNKTTLMSSGDATKTGVASADVDKDGRPEVVYVGSNGYIRYINLDGTGGPIRDADGNRISPDTTPGVA